MHKVFHFDSPPGEYTSEACVVSCFDARFDLALRKFLKRRGIAAPDHIKIAGAAKSLASPPDEAARAFVLDQMRTSMRRHGTRRAILFIHTDCGAYQGNADKAFLTEELGRAAACVREALPGLAVESYLMDFEGVWEVGGAG